MRMALLGVLHKASTFHEEPGRYRLELLQNNIVNDV